MKFSIQRAAFIKYLNDVQRAISSKTTIDILTGLKMDLSKDALTLTGSIQIYPLKQSFQLQMIMLHYKLNKKVQLFYLLVSLVKL